jgi:hypothetical protein
MFRRSLQEGLYRVRGNMFVPLRKVGLASHIRHGNFGEVCPGGPRETRRQTWHVAVEWIERVKEQAEAEGVSQAAIVDRAFRAFFT